MSLFDLPLEIFQKIFDFVVIRLRHEAVQLRLVNRVFDHEILLAYARNRILKADRMWEWDRWQEWDQQSIFMVPYFLHQRRDDDGSSGTDIISLMNHWVDRLARHSPKGSERDELRYQYMRRLLSHGTHHIALAVEGGPIDFDASYEFLFAATYSGDLELVDQLSKDTRRIREDVRSELFYDRLIEAAVRSLEPKIVEMLLRRGARMHQGGSDDDYFWDSPVILVAAEHWSPEILQLLLQPEFGLRTSGQAYQHAIVNAMRANRVAMTILLDHYTAPLSESPYLLTEGLREACRLGLIDIVRLLLDNGADQIFAELLWERLQTTTFDVCLLERPGRSNASPTGQGCDDR